MKKLLLIVVLFAACKKGKEDRVTITVLEIGTTLPVSGANVQLLRYHLDFTTETTFSGITDENGNVYINAKIYERASDVRIKKDTYYEVKERIQTTLYVIPEGWLKLRLHPVQAYPPGTSLQVGALPPDTLQYGNFITITADTDSTVLLRGFGGMPNKIYWQVYDESPGLVTSGTITNLPVPRFDTLRNITLAY
jgi:hypothetical protein